METSARTVYTMIGGLSRENPKNRKRKGERDDRNETNGDGLFGGLWQVHRKIGFYRRTNVLYIRGYFMNNYDEILLEMINEDNIDLIIKMLTDYLSQLEAS